MGFADVAVFGLYVPDTFKRALIGKGAKETEILIGLEFVRLLDFWQFGPYPGFGQSMYGKRTVGE